MLRIQELQNKLLHLIGWEQYYNTSELSISDNLTKSESGIYFQHIHPLLTLDNISSIAPDFRNVSYDEYSSEINYKKGNIVKYNDNIYKALQDNINVEPNDIDNWVLTNPFSEWLEQKTKASITKAITRFLNEKLGNGATKDLVENKVLFDGTGRIVDTIKNKNNLVGFEVIPVRAKGVVTKINKIGLQFTEPGEYTIYIMHSSSMIPMYTLKLTKLKKNTFEWFNVDDIYLNYENSSESGGSWYICYKQSEIPEGSQAIQKNYDWSKGPCKDCSRLNMILWKAWSKYIEIHPFYTNEELIPESDDTINLWDIEDNQYTYDTNYGLNLDISISCDLTDFIINNKYVFQDVIAKQLAVDMLREFAYNSNVRTNRHAINAARVDILYEIDGDSSSMKKSGLSYQLDKAFKALNISTEGIDRVCLPCVNNGIKYRTI